jgi:hypothetical protein
VITAFGIAGDVAGLSRLFQPTGLFEPKVSCRELRCESVDHARARQCRRGEGPDGLKLCGVNQVVPVLCSRFDCDVESESFELPDESSGFPLGRVTEHRQTR